MNQHPIIKGMMGGAAFVVIAAFLIYFVMPAWAVSIPITDRFTLDLGELVPWIAIAVTLGIWWDARQAKKNAAEAVQVSKELGIKVDGVLAERDKAKVNEGKAEGKQEGVEAAEQLAKGQRQGIEMERASAAAAATPAPAPGPAPTNGAPLPVADDRAAGIQERVAKATELSAEAQKRVADVAEEKTDAAKKS